MSCLAKGELQQEAQSAGSLRALLLRRLLQVVLQKQPQLTVQVCKQKLEAILCQLACFVQQARLHKQLPYTQSRQVLVRPQRRRSALHERK